VHWTHPGDHDYDERRALFNAMIDKRPRLIARCDSPADVAAALDRARAEGLDVAVRAGGHSVAGMSSIDDGLVVDLRPMKRIEVDAGGRRARVGAGATWGELDAATQAHGLATTGGRVSSTGVAGFTLGGGSGWLERSFGLACDNLLAVDMVTADGRFLHVAADEHPELFWALHGGGGNFGVVTALELALHPVGPIVQAGLLAWPYSRADEIGRAYLELADRAPDAFGSWLMVLVGPAEEFVPAHLQGEKLILVVGMWAGEPAEGAEWFRELRTLEPALDMVAPRPYVEFQSMLDDVPGNRHYWSADYHDTFSTDALGVFIRSADRLPDTLTQQIVLRWGGAVSRVPDDATPMTHREAAWLTHTFAVWPGAAKDQANIEWVRRFRAEIAPYASGGVYLNFIGAEGEDRIRAAFGADKYARLAAIKGEYDPGNLFRGNQNIVPMVPA